jgi:hypothetical protein
MNLNIIDTNTGIKYKLEPSGNQVKCNKLSHSKKNKRRDINLLYTKSNCDLFIKSGTWIVIEN